MATIVFYGPDINQREVLPPSKFHRYSKNIYGIGYFPPLSK
jgi:hypothetical protein